MRLALAAIALSASIAHLAHAEPVGIKGVYIGMTLQSYKTARPDPGSKFAESECIKGKCKAVSVWRAYDQCVYEGPFALCRTKDSLAGIKEADLLTLFLDNKVISVIAAFTGREDELAKVEAAVRAKYGDPSATENMLNGLQAHRWNLAQQSIALHPRPCGNAFWLNTPSNALATTIAIAATSPQCNGSAFYGNSEGMLFAFDSGLLSVAQQRLEEMDRIKAAKDAKDL